MCGTCVGLLSRSSVGRDGSVERVPPERSLWALAGQSGTAECSAASLQERFAARKAADLSQQAALAASRAKCQAKDAQRREACGGSEIIDATDAPRREAAMDGHNVDLTCCSVQGDKHSALQTPAPSSKGIVVSQAALRVEALKEELVAAEATVEELKRYLAEAEAELKQEQQQRPICSSVTSR